MTADEIVVGPRGPPLGSCIRTIDRNSACAIHDVDEPEVQDTCFYPIVADYVYPDGQAGR